MHVTVKGIGFSRSIAVPAGSTISVLAEKLEMPGNFYKDGTVLPGDTVLNDGDEVIFLAEDQKISVG